MKVEEIDKLKSYVEILKLWQGKINLVSNSSLNDIWERHIKDCLQLKDYIYGENKIIYDLGSGAGLPGIVLSIVDKNNQYKLIESDLRKTIFLSNVKRELSLDNVEVINKRIETVIKEHPHSGDIIISRALAPLKKLIEFSKPLSKQNGFCLFLKGENYTQEMNEITDKTNIVFELISSQSNIESKIIKTIFV